MRKKFILTAEGVSKSFDGFKAISALNFYLDEGELRTIIGPNGAGKSTMLDLITGRTRPDSGKIEYGQDTDLTRLNEYQINRLGVGRKFQTPSVYTGHTVFENLLLSLAGPDSGTVSMKCSLPSDWSSAPGRKPRPSAMARSSGWKSAC